MFIPVCAVALVALVAASQALFIRATIEEDM